MSIEGLAEYIDSETITLVANRAAALLAVAFGVDHDVFIIEAAGDGVSGAGGGSPLAAEEHDALLPEETASVEISDACKGAVDAFMRVGYSREDAEAMAIKIGFYDPDHLHGDDPHWKESAALQDGVRFVRYEDGSIRVFNERGAPIASMDGNGAVTDSFGNAPDEKYIDSEKCPICPPKDEEPEARAEVVPLERGPRVQTFFTIVECDDGRCVIAPRNFLVFDSEAEARAFCDDSERARQFFATFTEGRGDCIYITDGTGSVQKIEFEMRGNEPVLENGVPKLSDKVTTATYNDGKYGHMSDEAFNDKFARGLGDPGEVQEKDGPFDVKKNTATLFVSAPQELVYNPDTERYEYEPAAESIRKTADAIVAGAGLDEAAFGAISDMPLPAEFADRGASVGERAEALIGGAAKRGVSLSKQGAINLARIITEGQGKEAGLPFDEKLWTRVQYAGGDSMTISVRREDGSMLSLGEAVDGVARAEVATLRAVQGIPSNQ